MAEQKYISETKIIPHSNQVVFNYLSNFEKLGEFVNSGLLKKITDQVPQVKITDFSVDQDSCRFSISGLGSAEIRIVTREPYKTIKVESSGGLPLSITFWIQLLSTDDIETKMRLTLQVEMSMIVKMMLGSKLEDGINHFAETLARLPYTEENKNFNPIV